MRLAIVLAFITLAGAAPASADTKSEALLRDFVAWVDSSPDWSASASVIRSDGNDTFAEGLVFSRENPHESISIEELRLRDLAERQGGGFSATEMEMRAAEIITDMVDAKIPSATASGASLPSLAGIIIDPKHMMSTFARFYGIAAGGALDELRVPEITIVERQPDASGGATDVSYRNVVLTGLADGVLRRQEIGPISIAAHASSPQAFAFSIDKVEIDRTDLGALAHILDETQYRDGRGDSIWRPLVSRAAYHGLTGKSADGATFRVDEVAIENVDGRQPEKPFSAAWDEIMDPGVPADAKNDLALEATTGMLGAFRVGTVRLEGMSVDVPKDGTSISLDGVTLSGWSSAGLDSLIVKNFRVQGPEVYASLGSMELAGFVSPDLRALMQFAALEKDADPTTHAAAISKTFAALPRLSHFGIEGLVAGKSADDAASLGRFSLDFRDWNKIFAEATDIHVENLKIPRGLIDLDPQGAQMFDALGYQDLDVGMSLADRWTPDIGTDQATWTVTVADAGDVELSYTLTGLTMDWLMRATAAAGKSDDSQAALTAMLQDLGLARATLSVTDRSLLDRAFTVVAKQQGVSIDGPTYREQMRAALPFIISAVIPMELAKRIAPPLQGFMAGRQTLLADVTPPAPLTLTDILSAVDDPLTLPDRLNLKLTSEAPKN